MQGQYGDNSLQDRSTIVKLTIVLGAVQVGAAYSTVARRAYGDSPHSRLNISGTLIWLGYTPPILTAQAGLNHAHWQ
jgi:hypothetical protein